MSFFDDPPLRDFPDHAIRRLLENPANLRDLVADLRPDLAERLDFSRMEFEPREFLMEDWRSRECDLFVRIPYLTGRGDGHVLVCLLAEHQSNPDPRIPLRTLVYGAGYWEREWKQWEDHHEPGEPLRLTPIVPIVFYTGSSPWNASREFRDLFHGPEELKAFAPSWSLLFWDLSGHRPEDLLTSSSAWLQALAVVRLEDEELNAFETGFREVCRRLNALHPLERMRSLDLLWFVLSWAVRRRPASEQPLLRGIVRESTSNAGVIEETTRMPHRLGPTLEDLAEQRGEHRGRTRTLRRNIRMILEKRLGEVPESVLQVIEACEDVERLDSLLLQAAVVGSFGELDLGSTV